MKKLLSQKATKKITKNQGLESKIIGLIEKLNIPFCGTLIQNPSKKELVKSDKYFISPFTNISISGIGPVFYIDKKTSKIYTLLQRRFKDNYQWWFPGGYVELMPSGINNLLLNNGKKINLPTFKQIKKATIEEYYKNIIKYNSWQKAKKEINNSEFLQQLFKKHKINWPKEIDYNWQDAWQREVFEETGVDIKKYKKAIILDFKNNSTLMIGAEKDRLTNIYGKFCALLGILDGMPEISPDNEVEEAKWVAIEDINYDKKFKKYLVHDFELNLYTQSLIEESLFELLNYKIQKFSKIKNSFNDQEISRFSSPQNLQSYILEKSTNFNLKQFSYVTNFLSWQFGELGIGNNLFGKFGNELYNNTIAICYFLIKNNLGTLKDFSNLDQFIKSKISNLNYINKIFW